MRRIAISVFLCSQTALAQSQPRIGIFNLEIANLDASLKTPGIDALATALGELNIGEVVTASELKALIDAEIRNDALGCDDVSCLVEIGAAAGVQRLVTGSLARVVESLVVSLQLVDCKQAKVINRVTLKWKGADSEFPNLLGAAVELLTLPATSREPGTLELDGAPPGAEWRIGQQAIEATNAELDVGVYSVRVEAMGHTTFKTQAIVRSGKTTVVQAKLRRASGEIVGVGFQLGTLVPVRKSYASERPGLAVDAIYWAELGKLVIQPRFGVRFDFGIEADQSYVELVADVGAAWLPLNSRVTPFVGGGLGGRWVRTRRTETIVLGTVITTTHRTQREEDAFGIGGYLRAGVLAFRDTAMRATAGVDYNLAYLEDGTTVQALQVFLGLVL